MDKKEFSKILEDRTKLFAINILKTSVLLPDTPEGWVLRKQITKSGTSIGANYRETNRTRSKADFKNEIKISEGEASETIYWLEIIETMKYINPEKIVEMLSEGKELLALFTSISSKLK